MIRPLCRDTVLLAKPASPASAEDLQTVQDLRDTLLSHRDGCVGMAANMIGVPKAIIAVLLPGTEAPFVMLNPEITAKSGAYETEEGCLSLPGTRKTKRFRNITVRFQTPAMQTKTLKLSGYAAQIVQHETDHLAGILI